MIADNFQFYSDNFAFAAEAGLNRARAIFPSITTSTLVNLVTVTNKAHSDSAIANMTSAFDTAYEYFWLDGQEQGSLQDAFFALSKYILDSEGVDINTFITDNNIKVEPLYAILANIFGENIADNNIK